ncbi:MAG: succinyldiaminopimelate transaminase [Deltaproteobacteria bacterium]
MTFAPHNPALFTAPENPMTRLDAQKAELARAGRPIYDFGVGDPREPMAPFLIEALRAAVPPVGQYPRVAGSLPFRAAVAGYLQRRFGVTLDEGREILPAAGAKEAIFHLPFALIDRASDRRIVVYPEPGYPIYERGALLAGGEPYPVTLREEQGFLVEPSALPEAVLRRTALFWISYPHNPTGAVAPLGYLGRVSEAARRYGFAVASDECYADLYYGAPPHSILEAGRERLLAIHSLSKRSGMTGMRSGFMAGDPALIDLLKRLRPAIGTASPDFVLAAATAAWNDDAHAAARRACFAEKRELFLRFFREEGLHVSGSEAGLYLWVRVPGGGPSEPWALALAERTGIVVSPGTFLGAGGEGYFRLALVPTIDDCRRAIAAWRAEP